MAKAIGECNLMTNQAFVGVASAIKKSDLQTLLETYTDDQSWQFLKWPDRVELVKLQMPINFDYLFCCTEGQIFNRFRELRWKRCYEKYDALLLSNKEEQQDHLIPMGDENQKWQTKDLGANFYQKTETRFPRRLTYSDDLNIGQRYFINKQTGTVHFIALTVGVK